MDIGAAVAIGTVLIGVLSYWANSYFDRRAQAARMRTDAYLDWCRAQNVIATLGQTDIDENRRMRALDLDARNRILIYGSKKVVKALVGLQGCPDTYDTRLGLAKFAGLISAMREDAVGESLSHIDIAQVLVFPKGSSVEKSLIAPGARTYSGWQGEIAQRDG